MVWFLAAAFVMQAPDEVLVSSHAYVPRSPYTMRADTKLVEVAAIVRDRDGKAIAGLTRDDFRLLDDGKPRFIDYFVVENAPEATLNDRKSESAPEDLKSRIPTAKARPTRFLALFIDDVNAKDVSHAGDLKRTQAAAEKFVKDALKTDVRVGVFTASSTVTLDFTTDEAKLLATIGALRPHMRMSEDGLGSCPWVPPYLAYKIAYDNDRSAMGMVLADAAVKAQSGLCVVPTKDEIRMQAEETWRRVKEIATDTLDAIGLVVDHLGTMPGRRELLMASSGFLAVSLQQQKDKVIGRALRAGVVISALDSKQLFVEASADPLRKSQYMGGYETAELPFRVQAMNEAMANLAESTGGVLYQNNNDLAAGFRKLAGEPEVTYRLSFRPDSVAQDGEYHKLKVSLVHAKTYYTMQARPGYFAPNEKAEAESLQSKIDREMLADSTVAGFPVGIAVRQTNTTLSVIVSVDVSKLRFVKRGGRLVQRIVFTTALIDAQGRFAAAKEGQMDLALTETTYKRLASSGVNAIVSLAVPAGVYKLRQVSEEAVDGKLACSTHSIEIK